MKHYFLVIFVAGLIFACGKRDQRQYKDYKPHKIITVDLDEANNDVLDLISRIDLIPLESAGSFIVPHIGQMRVFNNRIYIYQKQQYQFACYSIDGKHIYTINRRGRGPGEYVEPSNFSITSDGMLAVYDQATRNLLHYDADGKFSHSRQMPCAGDDVAYVNDSMIIAYARVQTLFESDKRAVKIVNGSDEIIASYLPLPEWIRNSSLVSSTGSNFSYYGNSPNLKIPWCPDIFSVGADSLYCAYHIDYGRHNFPEAVFKEYGSDVNIKELHERAKAGNWVMSISFVQESVEYLFFQSMKNYELYFTIYDKKEGLSRSGEFRKLPVEWILVWKPFLCSDGNCFYCLVNAGQLDQLVLLKEAGELRDPRVIALHEQYVDYKRNRKISLSAEDVLLLSFEMN